MAENMSIDQKEPCRDESEESLGSSPEGDAEGPSNNSNGDQQPEQQPRRKGGRKPIYATSEERKQRNRQAQAAFRERRTEYIRQLEETIRVHEQNFQSLQVAHRSAAEECLMLRYKNSLLERILLEKGVDVQAELCAKTGSPNLGPSHAPKNLMQPPPIQRALFNRHHQQRRSASGITPKLEPGIGISPLPPPLSRIQSYASSQTSVTSPQDDPTSPMATFPLGTQQGPGSTSSVSACADRPVDPVRPQPGPKKTGPAPIPNANTASNSIYPTLAFQNHVEQLGYDAAAIMRDDADTTPDAPAGSSLFPANSALSSGLATDNSLAEVAQMHTPATPTAPPIPQPPPPLQTGLPCQPCGRPPSQPPQPLALSSPSLPTPPTSAVATGQMCPLPSPLGQVSGLAAPEQQPPQPPPHGQQNQLPEGYPTVQQLMDPSLDWDPFGLSASMAFPTQFSFYTSDMR